MNLEKLLSLIDNYIVISFDVFDTLIYRRLTTSELYSKMLKDDRLKGIIQSTFPKDRKFAEKKARNIKSPEVTLDDIYESLLGYSEFEKKLLKSIEEELEIDNCYCNNEMLKVFAYCKGKNKKIYIISDMYLSAFTIEKMLEKCGYRGYKKLYVSSEIMATKAKTTLFRYVAKDNNVRFGTMLHIGDNVKSDFWCAKASGISSYLYNDGLANREKKICKNSDAYKRLHSLLKNTELKKEGEYFKFGYNCVGPMLYGFSKWLHSELIKENITKVFFLAREGQIMQRGYECLYPEEDIQTNYVYVSRRSLVHANLVKCKDFSEIVSNISIRADENVQGFFWGMNIDISLFMDDLNAYGIEAETPIKNINFIEFINANIGKIQSIAKKNVIDILNYMQQEGMSGKFAVVDIGWNGTMQNSLAGISEANDLNWKIYGYYVGVRKKSSKNIYENSFKAGYLYNADSKNELEVRCRGMNGVFELCYSADHGSTIGYEKSGKIIVPILEKMDSLPETIRNVSELQNGALQFVQDNKEYRYAVDFSSSSISMATNLLSVGNYPTSDEIRLLEDFTGDNVELGKLIREHPFTDYLKHPSLFKNDLWKSGWKLGFLSKTIKIPYLRFAIFKRIQKLKATK